MAKKAGKKITYLCQINCPQCNGQINVLKEVEIVVPAKPAEKRERYFAEKGVQTTLPT